MNQLVHYEEEEDSTLIEDLPWHFRDMKVITPAKDLLASYTLDDEREVLRFEKALKKGLWATLTSNSADPIENASRILVILTLAALLGAAVFLNT